MSILRTRRCHYTKLSGFPVENQNSCTNVPYYWKWCDHVSTNLGIFLTPETEVRYRALHRHRIPATVDLAIVRIILVLVHCCMLFDLITKNIHRISVIHGSVFRQKVLIEDCQVSLKIKLISMRLKMFLSFIRIR